MQCHDFLEYAERWMEGERDATAAAHLKSCANCSALIADLESIGSTALELAEATPPERVWVSLRNQMEVEGLFKEPVEAAVALPAPRSGSFFGLRSALVTSFLAVVVVSGGFYASQSGLLGVGPVSRNAVAEGSEVLAGLASLAKATAPEMHEHNPLVTAAYKQNLEIVDKAIAMCEKTVNEQPGNEMARESLLNAYQQKADLLATMSQRGTMGD